jgi:hypothetical protein
VASVYIWSGQYDQAADHGRQALEIDTGSALPPTGIALLLSTLIFVASSNAALNGALHHGPAGGHRGRHGSLRRNRYVSSAIGPWLFGMLISTLAGQYWGGFAFLAVLNTAGAIAYVTLYRLSAKARGTQEARTVEMHPAGGGPVPAGRVRRVDRI